MNLDELILHPKSRAALRRYVESPTHALLLTGADGVGLGTIGKSLAHAIAGKNVKVVKPRLHERQKSVSINIDDVRELVILARDRHAEKFAVLIDEAEKMTVGAPEALLKILEEPNQNLHYILASHAPEKLPSTIRSRAQTIEILAEPTADKLLDETEIPATKRAQILFMAKGKAAEIARLAADDEYFRAKARTVETAKKFIAASTFDRLVIINEFKTRIDACDFVGVVADLLLFMIERDPNAKLTANLALTGDIIENLMANGNLRAQLTFLATALR